MKRIAILLIILMLAPAAYAGGNFSKGGEIIEKQVPYSTYDSMRRSRDYYQAKSLRIIDNDERIVNELAEANRQNEEMRKYNDELQGEVLKKNQDELVGNFILVGIGAVIGMLIGG